MASSPPRDSDRSSARSARYFAVSALPGDVSSASDRFASTCPYLSATDECALLYAMTSASVWIGTDGGCAVKYAFKSRLNPYNSTLEQAPVAGQPGNALSAA